MATLRVSITPKTQTSATLTATFTGGATDYKYSRALAISGIYNYTFYVESKETSGGSNTWSTTITDLEPGTTYNWTAVLCYWSGVWTETTYSKSGSFTTSGGGGGGSDSGVWIYTGSWNLYTPYIYNGYSWEAFDPYFYTGSWNLSS